MGGEGLERERRAEPTPGRGGAEQFRGIRLAVDKMGIAHNLFGKGLGLFIGGLFSLHSIPLPRRRLHFSVAGRTERRQSEGPAVETFRHAHGVAHDLHQLVPEPG